MTKNSTESRELNIFFNETIAPAGSEKSNKLVAEAPYHPGYEGAVFSTVTIPPLTTKDINWSISSPNTNITFTNTDPTPTSVEIDWTKISNTTIPNVKLGSALKFDTNKLPVNLLSTEALLQTAAVLKFGADKYNEHNWRQGFAWSRPLAAAMRHIMAFNDGEDKDPESGLSHLAHAMCCIMFLLEFEKTHKELDDRYKVDVSTTKNKSK